MAVLHSNKREWIEITFDIDPLVHEALSAFLFELGCTGIISDDPQSRYLTAYLPGTEKIEVLRRIEVFLRDLERIFSLSGIREFTLKTIKDKDWARDWRKYFRADRVTPNLLILPVWETMKDTGQGHVIQMDPGPAFGTGQHPTTRVCLEAMEKVPLPKPWSMLDVGTGSGILAMYGIKLGASRVMGIDIDPEALRWARHNSQINGLETSLDLSFKNLEDIEETFTLVVANLIFREIMGLMAHFPGRVNLGGWLILSGLLREEVGEVRNALQEKGFLDHRILSQEGWVCVLTRKGS